jgi:anti-sigma factor ChrR (cupin superfamily)
VTPQTPHVELTDTLREEIALHAFGMLEGEDATRVARHLEGGCAVCLQEFQAVTSVLVGLTSSVEPVAPSPDLKQRLLTRVRSEKRDASHPEPGVYVVRSGSGTWKQSPWEGIAFMRLYYDRATGRVTSLVRVDPGARYPAHRHRGVEQSWVLEGSCRLGAVTARAGDFVCAAAGTEHGVLVSDEGCLLLMITTAKDEVLL